MDAGVLVRTHPMRLGGRYVHQRLLTRRSHREHQRLRDTRLLFQYASVAEFCAPVEQITGRKVKAFHSSTDTEAAGHSVELFVLHPKGYDGPSRSEGSAT